MHATNTAESLPHTVEQQPASLTDRVRSLRLPSQVTADYAARRWWKAAGVVVGLVAIAVVVYLVMRDKGNGPSEGDAKPAAPATPPPSASSVAESGAIANQAKGYIVPARQILISPQVSGRIVKLNIQEGQRVKAGEVLAEIEDTEYRAERDRALAARDMAQWTVKELEEGFRKQEKAQAAAELREAKIQRDHYQTLVERYRRLLQTNTVPQEQFDDAVTRHSAARERVTKLENALFLMEEGARDERRKIAAADLARAEAELAKAEWRLANCTITAPPKKNADGTPVVYTILRKNAEEGNLVNPIAMQGSYSLCEMADLADLEVDVSIQERDIAGVFIDQRCKIKTEAYEKREDEGHVSRLMPIADRSKGIISVRVKITSIKPEDQGVYLKPEMSALVTFLKEKRPASR